MPAGLDRGQRVERMELRGVGDEHHVADLDDSLVAVEPGETALVGHIDLRGLVLADQCALFMNAVEEDVAHGREFRARIGGERLEDGTGVAPAAANHADAQRVTPGRMGVPADVEHTESCGGGQRGGGFQELPARGAVRRERRRIGLHCTLTPAIAHLSN